MSKYRLIAFDMDGTLLDSEKRITKESQRAIERAVHAGKVVVLSTGRSISEIVDYREELKNVRYFVCESGAYVYDQQEEKVLHVDTFPRDVIDQMFELAEGYDVQPYIMHEGQAVTQSETVRRRKEFGLEIFYEMMNRVCIQVEDVHAVCKEKNWNVEKLSFFCLNPEQRAELHEEMKRLPVTIACTEYAFLEISPLGVSKAKGLRKLGDHLGITVDEMAAVGDSGNDVEMMKSVGFPIAMGNATEEIRQLAKVVVADNDHGGCAEAVDKYLLSEF